MESLVGNKLGRYQIIEAIGRGGMATVYKGYRPDLNLHVAIKVLPAFYASHPGYLARFRREAQAMARLDHPNIVDVIDYGEQEGVTYLVMRYLEGGSLRERLGRPMKAETILEILEQVGSALSYAHQQGIVHRDIKPSNILFTKDGRPAIADFGIAKIRQSAPLTMTGTSLGTPEYMAPEQGFDAKAVDRRTDIYALGVLLYEMATGTVPYQADTPFAVLHKHAYEPLPPPRQRNPALSPALVAVIERAMAKRPQDRFQTADEFLVALRSAVIAPARIAVKELPTIQAATPPPLASQRRRFPWTAWGIPLVIALLIGGFLFFRFGQERQCALHYNRALSYLNAEVWELAIYEFNEVLARCPDYRDARDRLLLVEKARSLATLYEQALEAIELQDWPDAEEYLAQVYELDPTYREVEDRLPDALAHHANALLNQGELQRALEKLERAASLTDDDQVLQRRDDLKDYLDALEKYNDAQWQAAISRLRPLCDMPPGFGEPCQKLYEALVKQCYEYLDEGDLAGAREAIAEAQAIQQGTEVQECLLAIEEATPAEAVIASVTTLYNGPGMVYDIAGQAKKGERLQIVGKNKAETWWQVCCVKGREAWVEARRTSTEGYINGVPVVAAPSTPTPSSTPIPTSTPTPTPTPQLVADSWAQFSNVQGLHNWYYLRSRRRDVLDFVQLPWDGIGWWRDPNLSDYMRISDGGGHPGDWYDIARAWKSPVEGTILIQGRAYKEDTGGGDGVIVAIYKNGQKLWDAWIAGRDGRGRSFSIETEVERGDWLYFITKINRRPEYDNTVFHVKIYKV